MNPSAFPEFELLQCLLDDQQRRFQSGEPLLVESYLQQHPELGSRTEDLLTIIYNEIVLREQRGETPRLEEYAARFPELARELSEQFEMHAFVKENDVSPASAAPPVIEGYERLEVLGEGGMGIVYKARHVTLNRVVALKMIKAGVEANEEERFRFRLEAEAVARLQHPNIVQIFELGEHEGQPFLALELVEGSDLRKKLSSGPLPPFEAAALVEKLARAVHKAHLLGLVHRDLKPDNILLDADGTPKITDFGLARHLNRGAVADTGSAGPAVLLPALSDGCLIGSFPYMAPEQVQQKSQEIGPATDVYALGILLYELLVGKPPFQPANLQELFNQVVHQQPMPPRTARRGVPADLEAVCLKCLRKASGDRYESTENLADDLKRFQNGETVIANPVGILVRLWKWVKRRPLVAGLTGAVVASLLLGTIVATAFAVEAHLQAERFKQGREVLLSSAFERTLEVKDLLDNDEVEKAIDLCQALLCTFREVYDIDPADARVRSNLAEVLGRLAWAELLAGQFDQALEHAGEAMQYAPEREDIGINLAHAYLLTNSYRQAEEIYRGYKETRFGRRKRTCAEVVREDFQEFRKRNLGDAQVQANMRKVETLLQGRAD